MSILFNNSLLGASGQGPSADLGDTIEQSLRFRRDAVTNLSRTPSTESNRKTWTYSFWYKPGKFDSSSTFISVNAGANNSRYSELVIESTGRFTFQGYTVSWFIQERRLRDPSAWYHIVLICDTTNSTASDRIRFYVNGERETSFTTQTNPGLNDDLAINFNDPTVIGLRAGTTNNVFEGQLAQVYFLDGTAVTDTNGVIDEFGRYQEDGVWVPQDYTGSYGTNGFHLTFDSSQTNGIGHDSSGNGNHFTASGFDTADVALYSKDVFTSPTPFNVNSTDKNFLNANNNGKDAFDGSASSWPIGLNSSVDYCIWRPSTSIANVTSLLVEGASNFDDILVNGTSTGQSTSGSTLNSPLTVTLPSSPLTLTSFAVEGASGTASQNYFARISLGTGGNAAVVLVDNTDNDVDFNDTPTSNYATFSPIDAGQYIATGSTLNDANLSVTASGTTIGPSTQVIPVDGDFYAEFEVVVVENFTFVVGVTNLGEVTGKLGDLANNYPANSLSLSVPGTALFNFGTNTSITVAANQVGTIWGVRYNDGVVTFYRDGVQQQQATISSTDNRKGLRFFASMASTGTYKANYGQMPFIYRPSGLTDSTELQTNNLPEPTIKNGREYFNTVIWDGDDTSPRTIDVGFKPDLVWIKSRPNATSHFLYDSVRGFGASKEISSNNSREEGNTTTNTAGAGYVSGTTSTGFIVEAGTLNDAYVNDGIRDYVGWAWKAGGTAVSNTDGTITSSVSANTDAGFSIVTYTGTGSNGTIGHGLTEIPEIVFYKRRDSNSGWVVYSAKLAVTEYLQLHSDSLRASGSSTMFNSLRPTSSLLNVGTNTSNNAGGGSATYVAYCWHSVEGYSKFGSYDGNSSSDGVFIHLGFKPAWLVIKRATANGNWHLYDTTRSTFNPVGKVLYPNLALDEQTAEYLDILSNGFKLRTSNGNVNLGSVYIYMAFAENPFGGENAPPATAR